MCLTILHLPWESWAFVGPRAGQLILQNEHICFPMCEWRLRVCVCVYVCLCVCVCVCVCVCIVGTFSFSLQCKSFFHKRETPFAVSQDIV